MKKDLGIMTHAEPLSSTLITGAFPTGLDHVDFVPEDLAVFQTNSR
jgi:hypothetical protein